MEELTSLRNCTRCDCWSMKRLSFVKPKDKVVGGRQGHNQTSALRQMRRKQIPGLSRLGKFQVLLLDFLHINTYPN